MEIKKYSSEYRKGLEYHTDTQGPRRLCNMRQGVQVFSTFNLFSPF